MSRRSKALETIRKVKGGYRLYSKSGRNLGTYDTRAGAENREREVQYFKHANEDVSENNNTQVKGDEPMPKKQKPSSGASSPHPYQGRLVGEAAPNQQPLPVDMNRILKQIQQLESIGYVEPQEADQMRRSVMALQAERDVLNPTVILQLLTIVSR